MYNRTESKARALEADGAVVFTSPADAVKGASRVHMTLSDDAAVDDVLAKIESSLAPDATVVDHTTTSPAGVLERAKRLASQNVRFVHAPVFMAPSNALNGTGLMLCSGEKTRVDHVRASLEAMTGKLVHLGAREDAAASFKLLGNLFLMFLTTGVADMLALGKALDIAPTEVTALFEYFNPGAMIGARAKRMTDGNFEDPSWELGMARKDARLVLEAAERAGVPLAIVPSIAKRMDEVIAEGHAHHDWTVLGKDALTPRDTK